MARCAPSRLPVPPWARMPISISSPISMMTVRCSQTPLSSTRIGTTSAMRATTASRPPTRPRSIRTAMVPATTVRTTMATGSRSPSTATTVIRTSTRAPLRSATPSTTTVTAPSTKGSVRRPAASAPVGSRSTTAPAASSRSACPTLPASRPAMVSMMIATASSTRAYQRRAAWAPALPSAPFLASL